MGSLKDEVTDVGADRQPPEKNDDGASDGSVAPAGAQTSQESTTRGQEGEEGEAQPKAHTHTSHTEKEGERPTTKDQVSSGEDGDQPGSPQFNNCTRTDATTPEAQPGDDERGVLHKDMAICAESLNNGGADTRRVGAKGRSAGQGTDGDAEIERVLAPEAHDPSDPGSPDPRLSDPRSPAPSGQQHMHTQVSLEVVQCCSAATSPMTPPEGGHSFFFPHSFRGVGSDTKDAEPPAGRQVEFCSVATSPMTPRTPSITAFPELIGRESAPRGKPQSGRQEGFPASRSVAEAESDESAALDRAASKVPIGGSGSAGTAVTGVTQSQVTMEDGRQQCKQQRMGSLDQDITILVTHHGNDEEGEEEETIEREMVQIDEDEEDKSDGREGGSTGAAATDRDQSPPRSKAADSPAASTKTHAQPRGSKGGAAEEGREEPADVSGTKPVPESPAPFGCHNIRTQVSLEVVQCQSVATSPMTPPEGDHAFCFPSSAGRGGAVGGGNQDAELPVAPQVEFRSVGTAPMTPRTPTAATFPEVMKETKVEKKIEEEEEEEEEEEVQEEVEEKRQDSAVEEKGDEAIKCSEDRGEEKSEEPVQEVNWDEKGMTWEVYGAVVEVAVLGSAIQKHLEKQVKKQRRQPSMPPPPPLNPSAAPLNPSEASQGSGSGSGSGSGKGRAGRRGERDGKVSRRRRNPFRLLMENVHQPNCCSRAHSSE